MSDKNKGKEFLFSNDCGFISDEDGESYRYSDGRGYYKGKDGSEGYIYSDGSGYFNSANGDRCSFYADTVNDSMDNKDEEQNHKRYTQYTSYSSHDKRILLEVAMDMEKS